MKTFQITFLDHTLNPKTIDIKADCVHESQGVLHIKGSNDVAVALFAPGQWLRVTTREEAQA